MTGGATVGMTKETKNYLVHVVCIILGQDAAGGAGGYPYARTTGQPIFVVLPPWVPQGTEHIYSS